MDAPLSALDFQPFTPTDVDAVMEAEVQLHSHPWSPGNFTDSLDSGYPAWIAQLNGEMVGYAVLMVAVDEVHLLNISVLKAWQRKGIAARFLDFLLAEMGRRSMCCMLLEVRPSNTAALALYQSRGFARLGVRKGYYPAEQGREDAIVMSRELQA